MQPLIFTDWGIIDYEQALAKQEELFNDKIQQKSLGKKPSNDFIICTHTPVYTLGRHGKETNMLLSSDRLDHIGVRLLRVSRGGDITFHGLGQIVGYPIIDLEQFGLGIKQYIWTIEEMIIQTLAQYHIQGERLEGATGVWLEPNTHNARKICAIGVRASRYVTMHGFALNVSTDLKYFSYINPCGFQNKGVTSMEKEIGRKISLDEVKEVIKEKAIKLFK